VGYTVIGLDDVAWTTRPSEPGEAERHVAGLSDRAGFQNSRANLWRYEPGAKGRRHKDTLQEETFVVVRGTLTMYLGEPPEPRARRIPRLSSLSRTRLPPGSGGA
jgi:quercetin dioxygenase-like cupin family protein